MILHTLIALPNSDFSELYSFPHLRKDIAKLERFQKSNVSKKLGKIDLRRDQNARIVCSRQKGA